MKRTFYTTEHINNTAPTGLTGKILNLAALMALGILAQGLAFADIVGVTLNATTVTLSASQTKSTTAAITGSANKAVTWSLSPAVGSLNTTGNTTVYSAPATISAAQTVTITATSSADPTKKAPAVISLAPTTTVAVTLGATTATLNPSQTQSLTATVTGTTNTAVTWSLSPAVGSLTASGNTTVYIAPATISAAQTVTITATSSAAPTKTASAVISLAPAPTVAVSLNSTSATLSPSQTQSLTATVTGTTNTAVTWSLSPTVGSLVTSGNTSVYTAPTTISAAQTVTITATSSAAPTKTASAVVSLAPALTITPSSVSLTNSQTTTLVVNGASASGVTWSFSPAVGTLVTTGTSAVYTVPGSLSQSQTIQVQATSVSNTSLIAKAVLMLVPTVAILVTPSSADLYAGGTQPFTATVTGSTNTAVQWTLSPNIGTLSSTGVYTAPAILAADSTVTVTAIAQADTTKQMRLPVRLHSGQAISFTTNSSGLQTLVFNGTNYNYVYSEGLLSYLYEPNASGGSTQYTPKCSGTFTLTTVTQNCTANGDSFTVNVQYSTPSGNTVQAIVTLTNNSAVNTVTKATLSTLGINMSQFDPANSLFPVSTNNPLSYASFVTGRWAYWTGTPGPNLTFTQGCGYSYICKNQSTFLNVGPSMTASASLFLRFTTDMTESLQTLAPEAYTAYGTAYPYIVNWPDRRPIYAWFSSDHGHQSATNPRGYLWDPTLDVSNISAFQTKMLAQAQSILTSIKSRPVQPQGIVLWDLEGQEFIQPTTYVGDPRVLSEGYAPEMNAVADQVFAMFKAAGLKVGITLRPDYLQWGPKATMPSTCNFNSDNNYKDYYIAVDAPLLQKFYACYAPNTWSLIPNGNGGQTVYQSTQMQQVINLLLSKVAYARARWGTTLYYVDSTVWDGGAPITADIFRALQQAYPDSLFMPEESYIGTLAAAMPYAAQNGSHNSLFAPVTWRFAYPNGGQVTNLSNCSVGTCWTSDAPGFDIGQKIGDIAMYSIPQQLSATELGNIESMILKARTEAGSITVTDSSTGASFSYTGTPATIYPQYPVKMRVYFSDTAANMPSSSVYCENGGLLGTNSCSLNLAGLVLAQIRYYDFEGNLVNSALTGPR